MICTLYYTTDTNALNIIIITWSYFRDRLRYPADSTTSWKPGNVWIQQGVQCPSRSLYCRLEGDSKMWNQFIGSYFNNQDGLRHYSTTSWKPGIVWIQQSNKGPLHGYWPAIDCRGTGPQILVANREVTGISILHLVQVSGWFRHDLKAWRCMNPTSLARSLYYWDIRLESDSTFRPSVIQNVESKCGIKMWNQVPPWVMRG